jgi:hypothetical protein
MVWRSDANGLERAFEKWPWPVPKLATRLKTTPYLSPKEVVALACLSAAPLQALSAAGGYSDAVGLGAMGGLILFLLAILDNGVGIAAEYLTRIFEHGFTTRKNGHGFALHSGALAAQEMGGALTCLSAGPGQGAAFTLESPLRPPEGCS